MLGTRYDPSPIIWADGTPAPGESIGEYVPTSRPGSRAPHAWVSNGKSTIDLFGRDFVLLALAGSNSDASTIVAAAAARAMPLDVVEIDDPEIAALYEQPFVLVRPDGHVAWRGDPGDVDPREVIDTVRGAA